METVSLKIRAHFWYGTIFLFFEQIAPSWLHISAWIHAHVGGSRVDVVTLPDQNGQPLSQGLSSYRPLPHVANEGAVRWETLGTRLQWRWVWRDSLADFSQRWQGIRQGIRSRALTCSCTPWANEEGEIYRVANNFALWMNMICSHSQV